MKLYTFLKKLEHSDETIEIAKLVQVPYYYFYIKLHQNIAAIFILVFHSINIYYDFWKEWISEINFKIKHK